MVVLESKSAAATPAFELIAEGWNVLVQEGLSPDYRGVCPVDWHNAVLYACPGDEGEVVGVLTYSHDDVCNAYLVSLAYVEPTSRRQGVFRAMWAALLDRAKEKNVARVILEVSVRNAPAKAAMGRLGAEPERVVYELVREA